VAAAEYKFIFIFYLRLKMSSRSPSRTVAAGAGGGRAASPSKFSKFLTKTRKSVFGLNKEEKAAEAEARAIKEIEREKRYKTGSDLRQKNRETGYNDFERKRVIDNASIIAAQSRVPMTADEAIEIAFGQQSERDRNLYDKETINIASREAFKAMHTPEELKRLNQEYYMSMREHAVPKRRISSRSQHAKKKTVTKRKATKRKVTKRKVRSQYVKKTKKVVKK
jgi:hypothetical protein